MSKCKANKLDNLPTPNNSQKPTKMIEINSYKEIDIIPISLIVFDIDDTLIKFNELGKTWWDAEMIKNKALNRGDFEKARSATLKSWIEHIQIYDPVHINKEDFDAVLLKALARRCHIIFLTARDHSISHLTELHLNKCGIKYDYRDLYHSENKGAALKQILREERFQSYENIIVVDDMLHNLVSINDSIKSHHSLYLYLFSESQRVT
jgi:hypothetical protein